MARSVFEELNAQREIRGEQLLANPRNAAAGSMRQLDPKVAASRKLDIICFNMQYSSEGEYRTHAQTLDAMRESLPVAYKAIMIAFKLLLLPLVVGIGFEINRWVGRHDNWFTRILTAPGMWFQNFTTNEPDDSMIEVGIAAVQAVLPEEEGQDAW